MSESLIGQLIDEWEKYVEYIKEKYPSDNWDFSCPFHKRIDGLLKQIKEVQL